MLTRNLLSRVFAPSATPPGFPDKIVASLGAPIQAQLAAVERGAADIVSYWQPPPAQVRKLATRYASRFHADSLGGTAAAEPASQSSNYSRFRSSVLERQAPGPS